MREYRLIVDAINKFDLDLSGRCVYTEAASNEYLWTPIIAALAGADKVYAIAKDSRYATASEVKRVTMEHARALNVHNNVVIVKRKERRHVSEADIITNLGFVRPIDKQTIDWVKEGVIICLMWEPWEYRECDLDLYECRKKNIVVLGTNEHEPRVGTFKYVGLTVLKLLLENRIETLGCRVLLLGSGILATETKSCLEKNGAEVVVVRDRNKRFDRPFDCVVCIEHQNREICLIGKSGLLSRNDLDFDVPLVLHICGNVDWEYIRRQGWQCVPDSPTAPGFMSFTTAYVGPKPVIDLHTAGLKVGQAHLCGDQATLDALALAAPYTQPVRPA